MNYIKSNIISLKKMSDLIDAAEDGNLEKVKELVENGADPEAEDDEYNTPLDLFKKYGHTQMIEHLRDNYGIE